MSKRETKLEKRMKAIQSFTWRFGDTVKFWLVMALLIAIIYKIVVW